ncbi:MAG TPA: DUF4167 domain-containing protein, partial [Caulobacteraceae bacterium]
MRDFKGGMKRQRGRNRKPGGGQQGGAQGGGTNPNRSWDSTGPEGIKVRGNAQTVYERYTQLSRDAASGGDRVLAENYGQHAEHYFRLLRTLQPQRPVSEIAAREGFSQGFDIDFEDETRVYAVEPEPGAAPAEGQDGGQGHGQGHGQGEAGQDQPRRDDRNRDDRPREWQRD